MAETLINKLGLQLSSTLSNVNNPLSTSAENLAVAVSSAVSAANKLYSASLTTPGGATGVQVNVNTFGGINDNLGQSYALTKAYLILVQNLHATARMSVWTRNTDTNFWATAPFPAPASGFAGDSIDPGGVMLIFSPLGWTISNTNCIFEYQGDGSAAVPFNIVILGSQ